MSKINLKLNRYHVIQLAPNDNLHELLEKVEANVLKLAMERCKRNQSLCANELGISRGCLRTKLKEYFGNEYFREVV